ncbi:MAG: 50S ribosomal protein L24 [Chloroflexi bacterium]|nr:50S ribosomal protein L24 [Chloroflexota bacterium]MBI2983102.1 50S ribosomal protein L24 [Chloroflexota bacterium]
MRIRKGDEVEVIAGKDRGKRGTVQEVDPTDRTLTVAGVNIVKRHTKPNPQRNVKGGIVEQPSPLDVSKVMLVCPHCGKPTRVGHKIEEGDKSRVCKRCGEEIAVKEAS